MKITHCPDCTTGWRYVEDLPDRDLYPRTRGLVRCPTCNGQGRTLEPDEYAVRVNEHNASFSSAA